MSSPWWVPSPIDYEELRGRTEMSPGGVYGELFGPQPEPQVVYGPYTGIARPGDLIPRPVRGSGTSASWPTGVLAPNVSDPVLAGSRADPFGYTRPLVSNPRPLGSFTTAHRIEERLALWGRAVRARTANRATARLGVR